MAIRIGISTCPNDTFAFFPLLEKRIDTRGIDFEFELLDVQQLNDGLMSGDFDVAKASFHAALVLAERYVVFSAGSALGFGNGPLLLAARAHALPAATATVYCPGALTTATLLYRLFYHNVGKVHQVVFSEIMPALEQGVADFGVCIHEGRFTYQSAGLHLVQDLGQRWEKDTHCPLPLGGILGRKSLGQAQLGIINQVIRESVQFALQHRDLALPCMQSHAQELQPSVIWSHVDLYVNRWTVDLGTEGRTALAELSRRALQCGILSSHVSLEIVNNDGVPSLG